METDTQKTFRELQREPILKAASEACKRFGGMAIISKDYVIVDTRKYTVTEK